MVYFCTGTSDGGIQHCSTSVEAQFGGHVRTGEKLSHNERLPAQGKYSGTWFVRPFKIPWKTVAKEAPGITIKMYATSKLIDGHRD